MRVMAMHQTRLIGRPQVWDYTFTRKLDMEPTYALVLPAIQQGQHEAWQHCTVDQNRDHPKGTGADQKGSKYVHLREFMILL
jgi:hypothetical protein